MIEIYYAFGIPFRDFLDFVLILGQTLFLVVFGLCCGVLFHGTKQMKAFGKHQQQQNVHFNHCFCMVLFMHSSFLLSR